MNKEIQVEGLGILINVRPVRNVPDVINEILPYLMKLHE